MSFLGGGGSQSTNTVQNTAQTYNANPAVAGAGTQAIGMAQNAANQPFQMPVAPVAGFSNDQQGAFQNIRNAQGMALPYMNTAASYFSPEGAQQFFNPYAANVMAGMKDVFGQQQSQNEGTLVNSAGGVGADRIGVGQANLAHQQDLAAGQTLSGLYSGAVQQAQNAGYGIGALGTQAQNSVLQGAQAQLGAGGLQQQLDQMQLNAPYQNQLARIAYPYQNAQFLAGISGGLAPALGGTTTGYQYGSQTPPQPSMLSQVMGIGTAGAGLYGAFGGFGGGSGGSGGDAGTINLGDLGGGTGGITSGTYAEGGEVGEEDTPHIPGISGNEGLTPIPYMPLHGGAGHSAPLTGGVTFQQPQQQQQQSSSGGMGDVLKTVAAIAPFFLKDGGPVGYYEGGRDVTYSPDELGSSPLVERLARNLQSFGEAKPPTGNPYAPPLTQKPQEPTFSDRFGAAFGAPAPASAPSIWERAKAAVTPTPATAAPPAEGEVNPSPVANGAVPLPKGHPLQPTAAQIGNAYRLDAGSKAKDDDVEVSIPANRETTAKEIQRGMMPTAQQPYPDALQRGPGAVATRSPWMALVNAGATMAATPGPLGVSLGKGMLAGTKSLDDQRKELQSEEGINQKAQALYQTAKAELDKYNKMTPYESGRLALQNKELNQANTPSVAGINPKIQMWAIGKAQSAMDKYLANNPSFAYQHSKEEIEAMIKAHAARLAADVSGGGGAAAPAATAPAGPPQSSTPAKTVIQNGHTYTLQPDGSYK